MRKRVIFLSVLICTGCTLVSDEIQQAPATFNRAVVFDIDGTLTPKPSAIFTARENAAKAVQTFADAGYKIIYLSARVRLLQSRIPGWLEDNQFPEGSVHVPQSGDDSADHAAFKSRILAAYVAKGWNIAAAFGDSSTDFQAYNNVGIAQAKVFALMRDGETTCQQGRWAACWVGWTEHLTPLAASVQDNSTNIQ